MAVDWDRLVIGPTVAIFGDRVRFWMGECVHDAEGVYDEQYLSLTPLGRGGDGVEGFSLGSPGAITTASPVLGIRLSDFPFSPKQWDTLEILSGPHCGARFEVKEVQPDGHGHAKLLLNDYSGV